MKHVYICCVCESVKNVYLGVYYCKVNFFDHLLRLKTFELFAACRRYFTRALENDLFASII